jgi:hypothetical protein
MKRLRGDVPPHEKRMGGRDWYLSVCRRVGSRNKAVLGTDGPGWLYMVRRCWSNRDPIVVIRTLPRHSSYSTA